MTDALIPYRLSQPLTADEEALIVVEPLQSYFHRSGITVEHRGTGRYLVFAETGEDREETFELVQEIAAQFASTEAPLQKKLASACLSLRLILVFSDISQNETLGCLMNLARGLNALERFVEACSFYQWALDLSQRILPDQHPDAVDNRSRLATCLVHLGRYTEALPLFERNLDLIEEDLSDQHPDTLNYREELAICLTHLGRYTEAESLFEKNLKLSRQILPDDDPSILNNLANSLIYSGQPAEALPLLEKSVELKKKFHGDWDRKTLTSITNLANCMRILGRNKEAFFWLNHVLIAYHSTLINESMTPIDLQMIAKVLDNLALCSSNLGEKEKAISFSKQALTMHQGSLGDRHPDFILNLYNLAVLSDELSIWQELVERLIDRPFLSSQWSLIVQGAAQTFAQAVQSDPFVDWSTPFQRLSRAWVQILDLQPPEQITVLRDAFQRFQNLYLQLCLNHHRSDLLVDIVAAIQGRQQAAILLEEHIKALPDDLTDDASLRDKAFMLRRRLRFAALGLQLLDGGLSNRAMPGSPLRGFEGNSEKTTAQLATERQQWADYAELFQRYHELQKRLTQEDPDFALLTPVRESSLTTLQEELKTNEALVLLLHEPDFEHTEASPRLFALLIRSDRHRLFPMPKALVDLPLQVDDLGQRSAARLGQRHFMRSVDSIAPAPTPSNTTREGIIMVLQRDFWATLAADLAGIRVIHLITHGAFHVVPFAAVANPERTVYTYPGLVFYQHRQRSKGPTTQPTPTAPLGVQGYTAVNHADYPPIPLVDAEIKLIKAIWREAAVETQLPTENAPIFFLHLIGHGDHADNDPLGAGLLLGSSSSSTLNGRTLFKSKLRPHVVFLSACLVGRTTESPDGEPLGLVTALLLQGAHYVIAPLQPVNDGLMPLLAGLFHQAWKHGLAPPQALAEAKRRLKSGAWYDDTADYVQNAYRSTLAAYLETLLNEPPASLRRLQGLDTLRQWPLPSPYAGYNPSRLFNALKGRSDRFINDFLAHLVAQRAELPVDDLITWTMCFGGPFEENTVISGV